MPEFLKPYWEMTTQTFGGLCEADMLAPLLVDSAAALALAGLVLVLGLLCTLGKSQAMRWSALTVLVLAAGAAFGGWHYTQALTSAREIGAAGDDYGDLIGHHSNVLRWYWIAPLAVGLSLLVTLASSKKLRGVAMLVSIVLSAVTAGGALIAAHTQHQVLTDPQWAALPVSAQPAEADTDDDEAAEEADADSDGGAEGEDEEATFFGIPLR